MELTVQNVYGLLLRSRLMSVDDARAMFQRWTTEASDNATNVAQFAKWMVANRYVTEYQATLLARGHAEGFYLNQYKILERRGKGRMAGVYKAQHETGPVVAIKVLPPSKARDASLLSRFQREARLALKLHHPNVIRTFQVDQAIQQKSAEKVHYLVMEYVEGETLDDLLQRRRAIPPGEAARLIYQTLLGLQHLHEQGMVHRDLKPANLMLAYPAGVTTPENTLGATVKILDMGLARALADDVPNEQADGTPLTSEGLLLGTPDYMAPEQARDARQADIRSDIYSLGCVLFHLLDGKPPFPDTNIISQMIRHASETPRSLCESNPNVPEGLQQIVSWMMAKDPAQRYPTPERAARALQMFLATGSDPSDVEDSDPSMQSFLSWLKEGAPETEKAPAPEPSRPPLALPVASSAEPLPVAKVALPAESAKPRAGQKRKKLKRRSSSSVRLPPVKTPTEGVDVELVLTPPTLPTAAQPAFSLPLTRRDLVMFGIGAGMVTLGGGLGLLGAWLAGAFRPKPAPPDEVAPSNE